MTAAVPHLDAAQLRQLRYPAGKPGENGFLPNPQLRQINRWRAKADAAKLRFLRCRDQVRGVQQCLRRDAAAIEADAAEAFVPLNEDDFFPKVRGVERGGISAGAGAHDDDFSANGFHKRVEWWSNGVKEYWASAVSHIAF